MNNSMISAMVSMSALQQKLDITADNMANITTNGYKRKEATFEDILTNMKDQPEGFRREGRLSPLGFNMGWGSRVTAVQNDMSQGTLQQTNNPLDVAIEGDAMFEVNVLDSSDGTPRFRQAWTRDGAFKLQPVDADNAMLTTNQGYRLVGDNGQPIMIPNGYQIAIDAQGNITGRRESGSTVETIQIGRLRIVQPERPKLLQHIGDNMYMLPEGMNATDAFREVVWDGSDPEFREVAVHQGFIEGSNVKMQDEMTDMMTALRAYQLNARALTSSDTMMGLANNLRG